MIVLVLELVSLENSGLSAEIDTYLVLQVSSPGPMTYWH